MDKDWLRGIVFVAMVAGGYWAYTQYTEHQDAVKEAKKVDRQRAAAARYSAWATIEKEKEISPTETVKQILIPDREGPVLDVRCVIYINKEYKSVSMVCPNAAQEDLSAP